MLLLISMIVILYFLLFLMRNDIDHFVFGLLDGPIEISTRSEKDNFIPSGYCLLA